jgi:hypothetical protein
MLLWITGLSHNNSAKDLKDKRNENIYVITNMNIKMYRNVDSQNGKKCN